MLSNGVMVPKETAVPAEEEALRENFLLTLDMFESGLSLMRERTHLTIGVTLAIAVTSLARKGNPLPIPEFPSLAACS